jgi:hypothetical protein
MSAQSQVEFAQWLKNNHPALFERAISIASNSTNALNGLGAENGESFWSKFTTAALGLGTTYLALKNQRDAMKLNLERAKTGLPPIDMATSAPVVRTQIDMSPELTSRLVSNVGGALQTPLILAGVALVALLFFMRK